MKTCTRCGETKPLTEFYARRERVGGVRSDCKLCSKVRNKREQPWTKYRLRPDAYQALIANGCSACGTHDGLVIDHDRTCCPTHRRTCGNCVRGALCGRCNVALGMAGESVAVLNALIEYVHKYGKDRD